MKRPFFYTSSEAITIGVFPVFRIELRWRDATDGLTLIRPTFTFSRYQEYRRRR